MKYQPTITLNSAVQVPGLQKRSRFVKADASGISVAHANGAYGSGTIGLAKFRLQCERARQEEAYAREQAQALADQAQNAVAAVDVALVKLGDLQRPTRRHGFWTVKDAFIRYYTRKLNHHAGQLEYWLKVLARQGRTNAIAEAIRQNVSAITTNLSQLPVTA